MAGSFDHTARDLSRRGTRRAAVRLFAVLLAAGGAATHHPGAMDAKTHTHSATPAPGNGLQDAPDRKSRTWPTGPSEGVGPMDRVDPGDPGRSPIALGAYIAGTPDDPTQIDCFAEEIGHHPAIVMWYEQWGGGDLGQLRLGELEEVISRGATPMITWEPWDPAAGLDQPAYRLENIAGGDFDAYIDSWATALVGLDQPVYLRFGHEMNGDWYPWCAGRNGNTAADSIAAWRHLHGRFSAAGATNVRWVWSPNIEFAGSTPLDQLYPGDDYVDWVGLDGYNWGTSQDGKVWESFENLFLPSYQRLITLTAKPMMIAEMAATELGGDKAAWIQDAFLTQLPVTFPRVRALVWFNEHKETDWRVSSSATALAALRAAANDAYFQGALP